MIQENDVKNLLAWRKLLDETFKTNLAQGATAMSKNGVNTKFLMDGNNATHFTTKGQDTTTVIEFTLKGIKTFDVLQLQENIRVGQRIEDFKLEYWDKGNWKEITRGTTVGYKRIVRFAPVTTSKVRLSILSSRLNPTVAEFGLYKLPESVKFKAKVLDALRKPSKTNKAAGKPSTLKTDPNPKYNKNGNAAWLFVDEVVVE